MKKRRILSEILLIMVFIGGNAMAKLPVIKQNPNLKLELVQEWDKKFSKSEKVEHTKVLFKNRYGITIAADLYIPQNIEDKKLPAIAVSGPFGAVKEQVSGLYAQTLAERGFVTIAFDPSYTGESGGEPRHLSSPEINTEDFSAAVDFLGTQEFIDREKIGILGVCGWGGMALNAAASDPRIKAVATSVMYDMSRVMARGYNDSMTPEDRWNALKKMNEQRWSDTEKGIYEYTGKGFPDKTDENTPQFVLDYMSFYMQPRGYHARAVASGLGWTSTSSIPFMNMPLLSYIGEMKTPTLIVAGENAHSKYFSEDAYKEIGSKNKELFIVKDAKHVDLYDNQAEKIPFDKFETFFKDNLK